MTGIVTNWNTQRGFGFIRPDSGGEDIFVHVTELTGGLRFLERDQRVVFNTKPGKKGLQATGLRLAD